MCLWRMKMFIRWQEHWSNSSENSKQSSYQMILWKICPTIWVSLNNHSIMLQQIALTLPVYNLCREWIEYSIDSKWAKHDWLSITRNVEILVAASHTVSSYKYYSFWLIKSWKWWKKVKRIASIAYINIYFN